MIDEIKANDQKENGDNFSTHELPYSSNEAVIERWAKFAIKKCYAKARNGSNLFGANSSENVQNNMTYLSFVEKMLSIYEGSYVAMDIDFLTKEGDSNEQELPARYINYPLLKNNFDIITGQFIQTQIDLAVASVSPDAIDKKLTKRAELMYNKLVGDMVKSLEDSTGVELEKSMPIVDDEDKYITLTWKQMEELNMSRLLKINYFKHGWPEVFRKNVLMQFLCGFFAYKIVEINGDEIKLRPIDLRCALIDFDAEDDFGEDMMFFGEERFLSLNSVMTYFKPKQEVVTKLKQQYESQIENGGQGANTSGETIINKNGMHTIDMVWSVTKKQKVKIVKNKYNPNKEIVKFLSNGEEGKIGKKEDGRIEEKDVQVWYQGTLIGDVLVKIEECQNMNINIDNPAVASHDFVVGLYNRVLGKPNGMMASVAPLQELWNTLMYKLELEIATSPGNIIEYDPSGKPSDLSYSQVFYYMKAKKLVITKKPGSSRGIDLGLSSTQHLLNLLMYVEQLADTLTGTNKFKKANVGSDTAVGTMKTAIAQADLILEPPFMFHREAIRKLFRKAAAKLKLLNQHDGEKQKYILGETGFQYFTIKPTLPTEEYDIYFIDGTMQAKKKELLMSIFEKAWSVGQASIEHAVALVKHDDVNEIYAEFGRLNEAAKKTQEAASQMAQQVEQAKLQQPFQLEQLKGQINSQLEQMKKQFETEIAKIYADAGIKKEVVMEDFKRNNPEIPNQTNQ